MPRQHFGRRERVDIRRDFKRKTLMAARDGDGPHWVAVPAIIDEADAALFRLAHRHRNLYHEDLHNRALLSSR